MHWTGNPSVHFAFETAGYVTGVITYIFVRSRRGDAVDDRSRAAVLVGAAVGAMIGSRLLYWLCDVSMNPLSGKTIVGGLLGGLIGVEIAKKSIGITQSTGDVLVLPLIVAMAIGRIGCFLLGPIDHTAGDPTTLPWGIAIADGVLRHPVALFEIAFLILLIPFTEWIRKRSPHTGDAFRVFLSSYLAFRLLIDFVKPEPRPLLWHLTAIQWACVAGLIYYVAVFSNAGRHASVPLLRRRRLDLHHVLPQD